MKPVFAALMYLLLLSSCDMGGDKAYPSPPGYDLSKASKKIKVKETLDEISGIQYYAPKRSLVAINDEQGRIFDIDLDNTWNYTNWKFSKGGDYEDILFTGTEWYVLKSNGQLHLLRHPFTDSIDSEPISSPFRKSEFEGLFYRKEDGMLLVLCKDCKDMQGMSVPAIGFDTRLHQWQTGPGYEIDTAILRQKVDLKGKAFKPSAAAIHPLLNQVFVISAINQVLVVTDTHGKILAAYPLKSQLFRQPEGITFDEKGNLYISNEATDNSDGNILLFHYSAPS